jgi:hypothetical protein
VHGHCHEQRGNLENQAGEEPDRIVEEIGHPVVGLPDAAESESGDSSGPGMR